MKNINDILSEVKELSDSEKSTLVDMITALICLGGVDIHEYMEKTRFANGTVCPICGGHHVVKYGRDKRGAQRYKCHECGKTFSATTNTIVEYTKKDLATWNKYVECMVNGMSVRKSAEVCGMHRNTAFAWRHRVLDALQTWADNKTLDGIVEADETFFAVSYKGNHKKGSFEMPRNARHRGGEVHTRGLSHEQVCVPCAVSRNGSAVAKVSKLGRVTTKAISAVFDGKMGEDIALVTDKASAYVRYASKNHIDLIQLKADNEKVHGVYHIQHINAFHSVLKSFMLRFKGVATKYLNNYLTWYTFVAYCKGSKSALADISFTATKVVRRDTISSRSALPLLA